MLINELVSNSLKHAFLPDQKGAINIHLYSLVPNEYILEVKDNGIGLPRNLDLENLKSLGLQLVNNLTEQLNGKIEYKNNAGAAFKITFKQQSIQ